MVLYSQILGKHETQVTGTVALVQISNANSQQFTSNNSNSTFRFSNTNSQQIANNHSNSTFNSAQFTGFPARTAAETPRYCSLLLTLTRYCPVIQVRPFYSLPDRP
ncbi:hypothetical protein AVEN_46903-1 [Araneus ventricosus]|uniref:Uncharacterized protein n=1 Tax=Araneus ventricosus TaxID=182803 RepID=A0A4Y2CLT2_ARAVE|nr:hypothetical protein AVEN_46903-1 [Araneus ventricosus]